MKINVDEIITTGHKRHFLQWGSARPTNTPRYAGQDGQYMTITGVSNPQSGGIDAIRVPDPRRTKAYKIVGRSVSPPDLPESTLTLLEKHGRIPVLTGKINCPITAYEPTGNCRDLSDFNGGWSDYVLIYSNGLITDIDLGDRTSWDDDSQIEDSATVTWSDIYPIGALSFGDNATPLVDREVVDVTYWPANQCGDCGPANDGTQWAYALVKSSAGSPGLPAEIVYTTTGGQSWTEATITSIGATADPVAIDIIGPYLVVLTQETNGALYYATINSVTGAVGSFTKTTAGFAASAAGLPTDIWVNNAREAWVSAMNGYIYKITDPTSGVSAVNPGTATSTNLYRIHGIDETIVAVGDGATVVKSVNGGQSFATTTIAPTGGNLRAVLVLDKNRYWVGSVNGTLSYTLDGAEGAWFIKAFSGSGSGTIYDIVAATDEVLFFSHSTSTPTARLFASHDGGYSFTNSSPRILNLPTSNRFTRLALPLGGSADIAANTVLIGGLSGGGTDGILLLGAAARL